MTKEAETHAEEDRVKKESVEAKNQADAMVFTAEKTLKDNEGKIADDLKKEIEEKTKALREILSTGTKEDLEIKTKDLSDTLTKVGQAMYQAKGSESGSAASADSSGEPKEEPKEDGEAKTEDKKADEPVEGEVVN